MKIETLEHIDYFQHSSVALYIKMINTINATIVLNFHNNPSKKLVIDPFCR